MRSVVIGLVAVVWVATLLGLSGWVWVRSRRTGLDTKRAMEHRRAVRDRHRPERELERVVREATSAGAVVVVERRGADPVRVTWSDGSVWFFYRDKERYLDAQARGIVPMGTTRVGEAPAPGTQRTTGPPPHPA
ncbi:MAG TPA: hypothetical protein VIY72_10335 [Acidimicrobiales bacterium]